VVALPAKAFRREYPELDHGCVTPTGLPVQLQLLGGDADKMAQTAQAAAEAGALAIDINFGCPAPTVNRHDGGASLLRHPLRIREIVRAVREAVPSAVPVSAKLRLGWDDIESIHENAAMAAEGGASWLTIHARTRVQGYAPPVFWPQIGRVRAALGIPVVANGDIWTIDDFRQCADETGCRHFMIGRAALANPALSYQIAGELGLPQRPVPPTDWVCLFRNLIEFMEDTSGKHALMRLKQWAKLAHRHGDFPAFHEVKHATSLDEFFRLLEV
jgi:tRNA-dihydrouridine synthase C